MANTIILKKSSVVGKIPTTGDLTFGEVALNYADGKLYYKTSNNTIDYIANGGTLTNKLIVTDSTQATSTNTGALQVVGGVGIGKNLYVDGVVRIQNTSQNTTSDTGALVVSGGVGVAGNIHVDGYGHFGLEPTITYTNPLAILTANADDFTQIAIQNLSTGTSASSDFVATADDGTDQLFYIDMGINNSNYSSLDWTISGPHDGYLYVSNGNLTVGTTEPATYVKIHIGGTLEGNVVATFREPGTDSTSSFSGALTVDGGIGITGQMHLQDTIHVGNPNLLLPNAVFIAERNVDSYVQLAVKNVSPGVSASSDFIATADNGDDTSYYIDLGINNSGYSSPTWTVSGANDGYLYINSGNLTLGTDSTGTTVKVHVGGTLASNIVATFNEANTQSTSTTTGALVIAGGIGLSGNLYVGGEIVAQKLTIQYTTVTTTIIQTDDVIQTLNSTNATSTNSGALQVVGGAGIGGNLYVGGTINGNLSGTATTATNWAGGTVSNIAINSTSQTPLTITATGRPGSEINTWTFYSNQSIGGPSSWIQFPDGTLQTTAWTGIAPTANSWTTSRTITLGGDLTGSVSIDGSSNVTLNATVATNSVELGTDTTGNYVATGATSGLGISGTANTEGSTFTVASNATSTNTANTIVYRDPSGNFSANTITASLIGNVTGTATTATNVGVGSANQILYKNASNITTGSNGFVYDGVSLKVNGNLESTFSSGDEGGEIFLNKPVTNTTINTGVTVDVYQNKLRFFENGGTGRGFYIDITTGNAGAGTNLAGSSSPFNGGTITSPLTINDSTAATSTTTGALIVTGGAGIGGNLVANQVWSVNNGNGTNFKVGDDAWIGDINVVNTLRISGQQNSTQGYIVFGDSNSSNYIGRDGTNPITVTGAFNVTGVTRITNTTDASSTITGALVVTGGVGVGGGLFVGGTTTATLFSGSGAGLTNIPNSALNNSSINFVAQGSGLAVPASVALGGTASFSNLGVTSLSVLPGLGINASTGSVQLTNLGVTQITTGSGIIVSAATGTVQITNIDTLQIVTSRGSATTNSISIVDATPTSSSATGALRVLGGIGIGGSAFVTGVVTATQFVGSGAGLTNIPNSALTNSSINFVAQGSGLAVPTSVALGGTASFSNLGVTSLSVLPGLGINASTGSVQITNLGVTQITTGSGIIVSAATGTVQITNIDTLQLVTSRGATTNQAVSITNTTAATSTNTGALQVVGGTGIGGNLYVGGNIVVKDAPIVRDASTTSVLTTAVTLDTFPAATYRSAQYLVSVSNPTLGEYQTSDVLVVHNGTNSFLQATSVFSGNKALMNFSTTISGGNVLLQGNGNQTGANQNIVKIQKTYITI